MVNSRHKRAIDFCPHLEKVGLCEDEYADIVEAKEKVLYWSSVSSRKLIQRR